MRRSRLQQLQGIELPDERRLAGQLTGVVCIVGAASVGGLLLLPHVDVQAKALVAALAITAAAWGVLSLTVVDWMRISGRATHAATLACLLAAGAVTALTGGPGSSARFLLLLPLVFAAAFFPPREAWPYFVLVVATWSSPLLYDHDALGTDLLAELLIVVPALWLISFLMIEGKRQMVALRRQADALARRDELTGLANRRALMELLQEISDGRRATDNAGLLILDLDDFKAINTRFGHPGGDLALRAVGKSLRAAARDVDLAARLGGDEFAIVARHTDAVGIAALARRVLDGVRGTETGMPGLRVRVSGGWALLPDDAANGDELLAAADAAMRRAKAAGKDAAVPASS